jgi:hypothetical protein
VGLDPILIKIVRPLRHLFQVIKRRNHTNGPAVKDADEEEQKEKEIVVNVASAKDTDIKKSKEFSI